VRYIEALAITEGPEIKGKIWQTLLLIWAVMLVTGMMKITPPLLPLFIYQAFVLSAIIVIDYYTARPQKEIVLVWFLMIIAASQQALGF
jgi:hypothetical protein